MGTKILFILANQVQAGNFFFRWKTFLEKYVGYGKLGKKAVILDEYDREISLKEFLDMVDKKQSEPNIGNARLRDEYRFTGDIFY